MATCTVAIYDSIFTNNRQGPAVMNQWGPLAVINSTFSDNIGNDEGVHCKFILARLLSRIPLSSIIPLP